MELIVGLLYGGGIVVLFLALLGATPKWQSKYLRRAFCTIAVIAWLLQAGCWKIASNIGGATGGGGDGTTDSILIVSALAAVIWMILIFRAESQRGE